MAATGGIARPLVYTSLAMLAFAGNSIICRLALREDAIDPASFTSVRLASGAVALLIIFKLAQRGQSLRGNGSWLSSSMLFLYAICFSYAYVSLDAGVGALILFAFVQGTMIVTGIWTGDRPPLIEWTGWAIAFAGLVWLLAPGGAAPHATGAALMAAAGIAWGVYSLRGRSESNALAATTANFVLSIAMVILLTLVTYSQATLGMRGTLLAILSGALTSGIGYVIWYAALNYLTAMQAAMVQLTVPAIAAGGGILLLNESLTMRLIVASVLILGGICVALLGKKIS